ncbi:MAG: prolipoprotein diacylglyceryl transferase [Bacillota bacterium]|nr:prolipoprotein diacylglyceryl transferase [Bacillota bacterium]
MNTPDFTVSFPGLGIQNLEINREVFSIGQVSIYWYGLLIAVAVLLAMYLALRHSQRCGISQDDVLDFYLVAIPIAIVGARLYYVIFQWERFAPDPKRIFSMREGGLAFYGGVIAGVAAVAVLGRIKRYRFHKLADFFIPYVPLGQAIGRWGNFFNQEAFGVNTQLPWGMYSNGTRDYLNAVQLPGVDPNAPVHPTFLYESIANLLIYFILIRIRRQSKVRYEVFAWYLLLYGAVRFFTESLRTDSLYLGNTGLRVSMLVSAAMVLAGIVWLSIVWIQDNRRIRREDMAVLLGHTADGAQLDEKVKALDAADEALFEHHVTARQLGEVSDADTKVHDFSDSEAFAQAAADHQAREEELDRLEALGAAPSVERELTLDELREEARRAAERALHADNSREMEAPDAAADQAGEADEVRD